MNFCGKFLDKGNRRVIEYRVHRIEAQRIDVKFSDPIQCVLNEEVPYLIAVRSVEVERRPPGLSCSVR